MQTVPHIDLLQHSLSSFCIRRRRGALAAVLRRNEIQSMPTKDQFISTTISRPVTLTDVSTNSDTSTEVS